MKRLLVCMTVLLLALTLAACGGQPSSLPEESSSAPADASSAPDVSSVPQDEPPESSVPEFVEPENYNDVAATAEECDAIRASVDFPTERDAIYRRDNEYWDIFGLGEESYAVAEFLSDAGFYPDAFSSAAEIDQQVLLSNLIMSCIPCHVGKGAYLEDNYFEELYPILNAICAEPNNSDASLEGGNSLFLKEQVEFSARRFFGDDAFLQHQTVDGWPRWIYHEKAGVYLTVPTGGYGTLMVLKSLAQGEQADTLTAEAVYFSSSYESIYDADSAEADMPDDLWIITRDGNSETYELNLEALRQYAEEHSVRHILTLKVLPDGGYNILSQELRYPVDEGEKQ